MGVLLSPEERIEATGDYLAACERFESLLIGAHYALDLEAACYVAGELHGCLDFDTFAPVPDLVAKAEGALKGADPDLVDACNQCLHVMLSNAWAIERGAF